jgi:TetR/AcrR family transcriptional repressor of nem operon
MPRPVSTGARSTKQRLGEAGFELFYTHGYNGTSIQDIVSAAGVPKGTFYNHFSSKEDLALDSVARYSAWMRLEMLSDQKLKSPLARVTAHLRYVIGLADEFGPDRGCLLGNFATEIPSHSALIRDAVRERLDRWVSALADALTAARDAGELSDAVSPPILAGYVVSCYEGAMARSKVASQVAPLHEFLDVTLAHTLR